MLVAYIDDGPKNLIFYFNIIRRMPRLIVRVYLRRFRFCLVSHFISDKTVAVIHMIREHRARGLRRKGKMKKWVGRGPDLTFDIRSPVRPAPY